MRTGDIEFLRRWRRTRVAKRATLFARDDSGSLVIFSLFLFIIMIAMSGMAVDLMKHEQSRVNVQNTLDSAVLAASSLSQGMDAEGVVKDYVAKAGMDPSLVTVKKFDITKPGGATVVGRSVSAVMRYHTDTTFMGMMGINKLPGSTLGVAEEGAALLEIALVLDVSGSMGKNGKLDKLKTAAKNFVSTILENNDAERVMFSIIPYNHQIYMTDDLRSRLTFVDQNKNVPGAKAHPGAIGSYNTADYASRCATFNLDDMGSRTLFTRSGGSMELAGIFVDDVTGNSNTQYELPASNSFWCDDNGLKVMLYQNHEATIHTYIDSFYARRWTAIDHGMKWGVGVLDPNFAPIVKGMEADGLVPASAGGHPLAYTDPDVQKFVVLMTDGVNTKQFDLKDAYKEGVSPIYYSPSLASGLNPCLPDGCKYTGVTVTPPMLNIASLDWAGFAVHMPSNPPEKRWFVPNSPLTKDDDVYLPATSLPLDAQQLLYRDLYKRFQTNDVSSFFFTGAGDQARYDAHRDVVDQLADESDTKADERLDAICTKAKENEAITVFTIGFEAPDHANNILRKCATSSGHHFDVDGTGISDAFNSIAVQISVLKLKE